MPPLPSPCFGVTAHSPGSYLRDLRWAWSRLSFPFAQPLVVEASLTVRPLSFSGHLSSAGYGRQLSVPLWEQEERKRTIKNCPFSWARWLKVSHVLGNALSFLQVGPVLL